MVRRKGKATMTDLLRQAVSEADTLLGIEQATGIHRASLRRFRDGETSLRLDIADKLAAYFNITSQPNGRIAHAGRPGRADNPQRG